MPTSSRDPGVARLLGDDLRHVLRNGPFPAALHLAVELSGLTLEELQTRLAEHGVGVSVATLSYWRRGRSRPERPESLRAVRLLEQILALPEDSLMSLLGPPRRRGRWIGHTRGAVEPATLFADARIVEQLTTIGFGPKASAQRISVHAEVTVDADRRTRSIRVREVIRAGADRVRHWGVGHFAEELPEHPPVLVGARYCRIGEVRVDRGSGMTTAQLVLDRVLERGERTLIEYEWRFDPGIEMVNYEYRLAQPVREYVVQVNFAPVALPALCHRYDRRAASTEERNQQELWLGSSCSALLSESDVPAGIIGVRWTWPGLV